MRNLRTLAVVSAIGLMAIPGFSVAQDAKIFQAAIIAEENAQERIAFSGKLRMLSQRIPSAACHASSGVDQQNAAKMLNDSIAEFEKILSGLEFGDTELNINVGEGRRKTIAQIHETREIWMPFKAAAVAVAAGDSTTENLQVLLSQNLSVLGSSQSLVSELIEQYSNSPSTTQADLFLVDIAGRQRMLTQKMLKESCMVANNLGDAETIETLKGTVQMFELSLEALRFGMPELGIRKPPTKEISAGLEDVLTEWKSVKPVLAAVLSGAKLDTDAEMRKFQGLNKTMGMMNNVVGMYAEASKPST